MARAFLSDDEGLGLRNFFGTKVMVESSVSVSELKGLGTFLDVCAPVLSRPGCLADGVLLRLSALDFKPVNASLSSFRRSESRQNASSIQSPKSSMTPLASLIKAGIWRYPWLQSENKT